VEWVRSDPWYSTITVGIDVLYAVIAVLLAHWTIPGDVREANLGLYSWIFVPVVIGVLATRSM
jgi:hypothetical protein